MQLNTDINYRLQHAAKPDHSGGGGGGGLNVNCGTL